MFEKIKTVDYKRYLQELRDVRMVGLLVFGVVVLLVTWSGISVIQTNYELQKQISRLQQEVDLRKLENSNLKLRNGYYDTDQYLELQARKQFGKAAEGEKLLLVPKSVALAHSIEVEEPENDEQPTEGAKPFYQQHFEAWMEFLFRR
jgi:cell division protein FtsB